MKDEQWHLDKKVPLAMIIAIAIQTAGAVWFMAKMDSRIQSLEDSEKRAEVRFGVINSDRDRLVRVEEQVKGQTEILRRIETRLFFPAREVP